MSPNPILQKLFFYVSFIKTIFISKIIRAYAKIVYVNKADINLNEGFYNNLEENFEQAYELSQKDFSHEEFLELLKNGNIPQKQIAALEFDYVKTEDDAKALLNNLTGCDGKIREAVALKINQILSKDSFSAEIFAQISAQKLADATIDINGNICRLAVDSACLLKSSDKFSKEYTNKIVVFTKEALDEISKFIFRDKKYVINKQIFKLYWCLEAIKYFHDYIDLPVLEDLLVKCAEQKEYTVREKVAQIINISGGFKELRSKLENDENYYVRAVFNISPLP